MNSEQIKELIKYLKNSYPNYEFKNEMIEYWEQELSQYEYEDIKNKLKELMGEERYSYQPPLLEAITRGITKKHNKVDFNELVYFCRICRRPFNSKEELDLHEDRCRSIRYIEKQYKRFNWGEVKNKAEMYNMSEEEFDKKYKIILRKVQNATNDELEKTRIEFIFNPPSQEQARKFLNE